MRDIIAGTRVGFDSDVFSRISTLFILATPGRSAAADGRYTCPRLAHNASSMMAFS
jgi:hypothetical protein